MPPVTRDDPYTAYNFQVTVTGISTDGKAVSGSFSEVSGLEWEIPSIPYRYGSDPIRQRKIPGLEKITDITLKRGVTGHVDFWKWILKGINGQVDRQPGSIILLDENRQKVMRWNFDRGWPTKFTGPTMHAGNNEIAIETLVICCESLLIDV